MDLGCGNGYLLKQIRKLYREVSLFGVEFTPELCELAQSRNIDDCKIIHGSIKDPTIHQQLGVSSFDIILTERVIINLLSWKQQRVALNNISSWLNDSGHYILAESFRDSLNNLNQARAEFGIPAIPISKHNCFLTRNVEKYLKTISLKRSETLTDERYLSTHFYLTRVVHSALRPEGGRRKDTRFAGFFNQALPPAVGDYSPILFFHYVKDISF